LESSVAKKLYAAEGSIDIRTYFYVGEGENVDSVARRAFTFEVGNYTHTDWYVDDTTELTSTDDLIDETEFAESELHFAGPTEPRYGEAYLKELRKTPEQRAEEAAMAAFLQRQLRLPGLG
jgi:hypothetical protein